MSIYTIFAFFSQLRPESVGTPRSVGLVNLIIIIHSVLYFCLSNILLSKVNKNYNAVQSRLVRYLADDYRLLPMLFNAHTISLGRGGGKGRETSRTIITCFMFATLFVFVYSPQGQTTRIV